MPKAYDAIVVGSGISGGWAAKELTRAGTAARWCSRRGGPIDPAKRLRRACASRGSCTSGARATGRRWRREQPVQKNCYACDEWGSKFFVNDLDNPYTTDADKPFHWIRGRQVGGRSITWGRQVYRWSDLDFEANARTATASTGRSGMPTSPRGTTTSSGSSASAARPKGSPSCRTASSSRRCSSTAPSGIVREKLKTACGGERSLTIGRAAILTQDHNGRAACHYCGPCERGCITHSYFNSIGSTLPPPRATGRLTLRPHSVVHSVIYDRSSGRATGVRVIDAQTMEAIEFQARVVFLCASALESTRILLNSTSPRIPDRARQLQRRAGTQPHGPLLWGAGARGTIPGMEDRTLRQPAQRHLRAAVPERHGAAPRLRARLRLPGRRRAASGWGRGAVDAGYGAGVQARRCSGTGAVALHHLRVGRMPAARRQLHRARPRAEGQVGDPGAPDPLHLGRQRAGASSRTCR